MNQDPEFLIVDLFCGAGGVSTGFATAQKQGQSIAKVIACVNHDPIAIKSHWRNHPEVKHFEEDIRTLDLTELVALVAYYRTKYRNAKLILWASLECTNFSKAKGGMPREADSRTLAEHLDRYVIALDPDYIQIENVVEFMSWGPLDEKGKPVSRKNGRDWVRWRNHLCGYGYRDEWRQMNAADYGAYTSRNRLFGIFAKDDLPIVWPRPTHSKNPGKNGIFGDLKKWKPVRECLDFSDEGQSIFGRKKPLVEKTLERIYAGLVKFVANGDDSFITKFFSGQPEHKNSSMESPAGTITTTAQQGIVFITQRQGGQPESRNISVDGPARTLTATAGNQDAVFITQSNGGLPSAKVTSENQPARTITTADNKAAVFLTKYNSSNKKGQVSPGTSLNEPCHTLAVQQRIAVTTAEFMCKYYGNGHNLHGTDSPAGTLTTKDRMCVVFLDQQYGTSRPTTVENPSPTLTTKDKFSLCFIDRNFSQGGGKHVDIEGPMGALMTVPKANLVSCEPWIMQNQHENRGKSIDDPAPTLLTGNHHYLMNPQYASKGSDLENPCFTLIARMDKMPPYLVSTESGQAAILIFPEDSQTMQKIKVFMAVYGIVDIKMRMLKVPELLRIQGFPKSYKLSGTQTDQKKFIGNSVVPQVVKAWTEALGQRIETSELIAA